MMEKANSKLSSKKIVEFVNVIPGNCSGQYFREMTGLYNKVLWTVAFVLGFYFLWMDIAMYHHIQNWSHNQKKSEGFDPFNPLTVKLITIDHFTHYIHTIGSEYFEIVTHFAEVFPNITPNMISFTHMTCAIIGGRLIACEKLHWRQVGVGLFQLRDFLDSLDGVVFRVHSKQRAFTSVWGTSGYMVDIMCDIVAGLALFAGVWTYFWRYPPMQPPQACLRMAEEGSVTKRPGDGRVSRGTVVTVLIAFGIRFLFIGGLWDHFVHKYHDQLEVTLPSPSQQRMQEEIFHSSFTWVLWWFWRIGNGSAIMQFIVIFIFIDKLWEFLVFTHYIGWVHFVSLILASQIHIMHISSRLSALATTPVKHS